jgi:cadmium resistance protein CadD (predicted permease)
MQLITYTLYAFITAFIVLRVGWVFYSNGAHYLEDIFTPNHALANSLNRLLLIGYYLLNLGYVAVSLSFLESSTTWVEVIENISRQTAIIVLGLGIMHYFNLFWVKWLKPFLEEKTIQ